MPSFTTVARRKIGPLKKRESFSKCMRRFVYILVSLAAMIGCYRTPGVRSSQGGGGAANAPATERSPEATPSVAPQ